MKTRNERETWAKLQRNRWGNPDEYLQLFAVTGTNGKTTTAFLLQHLQGKNCGRLTTIDRQWGSFQASSTLTTPDAADFYQILGEARQNGCDALAFEASSHGLDQARCFGCRIDSAIFTQLSQDHLDYHGTMESYFDAKCRLFDGRNGQIPSQSILGIDDFYGQKLREKLRKMSTKCLTFGENATADLQLLALKYEKNRMHFEFHHGNNVHSANTLLLGKYNALNILAAFAALIKFIPLASLLRRLSDFPGVPGRLEMVLLQKDRIAYVDFAHTPDALQKTLETLHDVYPHQKIVTVFGCGGERDRAKRPQMSQIALQQSHKVILTSDNPRNEPLKQIFADGKICDAKHSLLTIYDRREAIELGIQIAFQENAILLVAGKGHESFQEIRGQRFPFHDKTILQEFAKIRAKTNKNNSIIP